MNSFELNGLLECEAAVQLFEDCELATELRGVYSYDDFFKTDYLNFFGTEDRLIDHCRYEATVIITYYIVMLSKGFYKKDFKNIDDKISFLNALRYKFAQKLIKQLDKARGGFFKRFIKKKPEKIPAEIIDLLIFINQLKLKHKSFIDNVKNNIISVIYTF